MKRKLTAEEMALNESFRKAIRAAKDSIPSLASVKIAEFLYPEEKRILVTKPRREAALASRGNTWLAKLTIKLDRLTFPELTNGESKLTEGKALGRLIGAFKQQTDDAGFTALQRGLFGHKVSARVNRAVWEMDDVFLSELASGLQFASPMRSVYQFLIANRNAVSQCSTKAQIVKLPGFPAYNAQSVYRLCAEVGLPASK